MNNVKELVHLLKEKGEKIIFSESCTSGKVASMMGEIPGVSEVFCGSFVTYCAELKTRTLAVLRSTIDKHTTESDEVADEMACGALEESYEATWSAAIVGHLGPDAPSEKDGKIYISVICKHKGFSNNWKYHINHEYTLKSETRQERMIEAAEYLISQVLEGVKKQ